MTIAKGPDGRVNNGGARIGAGAKPGVDHIMDRLAAIGEASAEQMRDPNNEQEPISQDLAAEKDQVKMLAKADLNMLAGLAMPDTFAYFYPAILLAAWMLLTQTVFKVRDFSKIALGIPRGFGKTTLVKLFVLYCILFTRKKFILIIGSTATHAENIVADIAKMLSHSNIVSLFGNWKLGIETDRADLKKFGFLGRNIILLGIGAQGAIRGVNLNNDRPDVMIFEDIQTAEDAKSSVVSEAIETWMLGTAMKAKAPHGCLYIFCGNMYPGPNSILKRLKKNKTWIKFISGGILADGTSLWPAHRSIEELIEELDSDIASGHAEIFFAEVLNDTEAGINSAVDFNKIRKWPYSPDDLPQGKCIIIDPASSKKQTFTARKKLDPTTIMVMEVYDGVPGFTYILEDQLSPGTTIYKALALALERGISVICIEATSYQSTLCYWFNEIINKYGITGIQALPLETGGAPKNSRISNGLKALQANPPEILIHDSIRAQVVHQIANWNPMKRDNEDGILDCISYGPKALELYGELMHTRATLQSTEDYGVGVIEDTSTFMF